MSLHYPHHVGKIVPGGRASSERVAHVTPGRHLDVAFRTANDNVRPERSKFIGKRYSHLRTDWREAAAVVGGIVVLLITAWLIWAALAEAVIAAAHAA